MARQVHWTHDPRYAHLRNPPAWYRTRATPVYTPRPSAKMEKQAADERRRQWQWQNAAGFRQTLDQSFFESICWPCGSFARTSARFRAGLGGRDAANIPRQGVCGPDCLQFALCLPFYGCLLARLQTTVRSFYDIDSSDVSDWFDGCCCPCLTLVRNEQEILVRERQHWRLKSFHAPEAPGREQYKPQTPMSYEEPQASPPPERRERTPSPEPREEPRGRRRSREPSQAKTDLADIPESSREQSLGGRSRRGTQRPSDAAPQEEQPDRVEAGTQGSARSASYSAYPRLQYQGQVWYLVPSGKENLKPGSDHDEAASPQQDEEELGIRHMLPEDELVVTRASHAAHSLDDDVKLAHEVRNSRFAAHLLEDVSGGTERTPSTATQRAPSTATGRAPSTTRERTPSAAASQRTPSVDTSQRTRAPSVQVSPAEDTASTTTARERSRPRHDLDADETAPVRKTGPRGAHMLDEDERVYLPQKRTKHQLDADEPVGHPNKSAAHTLDEDEAAIGPANQGHPPHELEEHQETPGAWPRSAPHGLGDDKQ